MKKVILKIILGCIAVASGGELYRNAKIEGKSLREELTNIRIDNIL